jgi:hypothetical protein
VDGPEGIWDWLAVPQDAGAVVHPPDPVDGLVAEAVSRLGPSSRFSA